MEDSFTSKRHKRYLLRFQRNRKRWESSSGASDIRRLRQIEIAYFTLLLYFLSGSRAWLEYLISPSISWMTLLGVLISSWIAYMCYDLYWVNKSITYMLENSIKDISQIEQKEAEQVADDDAEKAV